MEVKDIKMNLKGLMNHSFNHYNDRNYYYYYFTIKKI